MAEPFSKKSIDISKRTFVGLAPLAVFLVMLGGYELVRGTRYIGKL